MKKAENSELRSCLQNGNCELVCIEWTVAHLEFLVGHSLAESVYSLVFSPIDFWLLLDSNDKWFTLCKRQLCQSVEDSSSQIINDNSLWLHAVQITCLGNKKKKSVIKNISFLFSPWEKSIFSKPDILWLFKIIALCEAVERTFETKG